jgi:hypothetical protein
MEQTAMSKKQDALNKAFIEKIKTIQISTSKGFVGPCPHYHKPLSEHKFCYIEVPRSVSNPEEQSFSE